MSRRTSSGFFAEMALTMYLGLPLVVWGGPVLVRSVELWPQNNF